MMQRRAIRRVGILVASSPIDELHMNRGHQVLRGLGLEWSDECDPLRGELYISKEPAQRVRSLVDFLTDEGIDAIWLARGGYGANLMLPELDRLAEPLARKPVLGSSDGCYLLWYLMERWGFPVYLAPMIYASMTDDKAYDLASLKRVLEGAGGVWGADGVAFDSFDEEGLVTGGCLSMLSSLVKTPYMPTLKGRLVIIEDINERPFRLERMVWHLLTSGSLDGVRAILFGLFPGCFKSVEEKSHFYRRMRNILAHKGIPFAYDFPLGHGEKMVSLPLGVSGRLWADGGVARLDLSQVMAGGW